MEASRIIKPKEASLIQDIKTQRSIIGRGVNPQTLIVRKI
jgi:hypothetical protein